MKKMILAAFVLIACLVSTQCYQPQPPANACSQSSQHCNCRDHSRALEKMVSVKLLG